MGTEKRDRLATATALVLPAALQDLEKALGNMKVGKVGEGAPQIQDAVARLKALAPLCERRVH